MPTINPLSPTIKILALMYFLKYCVNKKEFFFFPYFLLTDKHNRGCFVSTREDPNSLKAPTSTNHVSYHKLQDTLNLRKVISRMFSRQN